MNERNFTFWTLIFSIVLVAAENLPSNHPRERRREEKDAKLYSKQPSRGYSIPSKYQDGNSSPTSIKEALLTFQVQNVSTLEDSPPCSGVDGRPCPSEENPCLPLIYCAAFYKEVLKYNTFCKLGSNAYGARCRLPREVGEVKPLDLAVPGSDQANSEALSETQIKNAMQIAFDILKNREEMEKELTKMGIVVTDPKTPEYGHLQLFRTYPRAINRSKIALIQEYATNSLKNSLSQDMSSEVSFNASGIESPIACPAPPNCEFKDLFYRTPNGSCNNLEHPSWGMIFTPFQRLTSITYDDGISVPRKSVTGKPLPSARRVSAHTIHDADVPSTEFTLSMMQWGQFMDHDLTHTPISIIDNITGIQCCTPEGLHLSPSLSHPECFPIDIPENDTFYSMFGQRCMNFVRSLPAPSINCRLGFRNQMNQLTHLLDGSMVYGSSRPQAVLLREFKNGLLKVRQKENLPDDLSTDRYDFLAGDSRVNEQPLLTVIHTVWVRQHNRVARELIKLQPQFNDETLYQETRKIVIGQIQHIAFNEWLPNLLGPETVETYNLLPKRSGFANVYNKTLNPTLMNEFSSAAFRFGHTLIQGTIRLFGKKHEEITKIELSDNFDKPQIFLENTLESRLLRSLFNQPIQRFDNCIVDDLTNKLLKTDATPFGMDLIALNTQRARDHGIGTYNDILAACKMPRVESFYQLHKNMRPNAVPRFSSLYESVDDIDPFVAGVSELPVHGGILGGIFNCIIREQWFRLKFGDRFYYENGGMQSSFTEAQLNEIKKISWARIICDNSQNNVQKIQPLAFRLSNEHNAKVPCSSDAIPQPDFSSWYEN